MTSDWDVVLLVGHGSRSPAWFEAVDVCVGQVRAQLAGVRVELAYLDHHPDVFGATLDALVARGLSVAVVPLLMAPGGHLLGEIQAHIETLRDAGEGARLALLPTLTEFEGVGRAYAQALQKTLTLSEPD